MSFNPEDPVQMSMMALATAANECNLSNPREAELSRFLKSTLDSMQGQQHMVDVLKKLSIGFNAIISSLDGSAEWHAFMIDVASTMFDGIQGALVEAGEPLIRKAQFGDPLTSEIAYTIPSADDPAVVAKSPYTTPEKLAALSESDDWQIRAAVASNPTAPEDLLRKLATDQDEGVRSYAARNQSTPIDVLETLATDPSEYVRDFLAQNPAIPVSLMERLANDSHWRPRSGIAENPNAPEWLLSELRADPDARVRDLAGQAAYGGDNPSIYDEDIPF